jgi:hypothetical protein
MPIASLTSNKTDRHTHSLIHSLTNLVPLKDPGIKFKVVLSYGVSGVQSLKNLDVIYYYTRSRIEWNKNVCCIVFNSDIE